MCRCAGRGRPALRGESKYDHREFYYEAEGVLLIPPGVQRRPEGGMSTGLGYTPQIQRGSGRGRSWSVLRGQGVQALCSRTWPGREPDRRAASLQRSLTSLQRTLTCSALVSDDANQTMSLPRPGILSVLNRCSTYSSCRKWCALHQARALGGKSYFSPFLTDKKVKALLQLQEDLNRKLWHLWA